jgi:hypothetical protein
VSQEPRGAGRAIDVTVLQYSTVHEAHCEAEKLIPASRTPVRTMQHDAVLKRRALSSSGK